jgi:signal transduction histidine kinase
MAQIPKDRTEPAPSPRLVGRIWFPWVIAVGLWGLAVLAAVGALRRWHERELAVLEEQADAVVHSLGSALRAMSGRVQRTEGMLERILGDIVQDSTVTGIALVDRSNQCIARVGLPEAWLTQTTSKGARPFPSQIVVWDTVDVGRYRPGHMRGGAAWEAAHAQENSMRLFVSMPLDKLHGRWQRDRAVVAGLCVLALGMAAGVAAAWSLARRSAAYSARLRTAEEQARTLAEVNLVAAGVAHEIKNPLGVVRGTAQRLATAGTLDEDAKEALGVIMGEIDRTTSRVNELLSFAKPTEPTPKPVALRQLLGNLGRLLEEELADAGMALDSGAVPEQTEIMADPELLRRLLFNLIHNAIRYAQKTGPVEIAFVPDGKGRGTLSVRDHGEGVPEDLREKVFSAYFTTRAEGTGLGLAVVRRIASAHGWDIVCRNAPDGGALFEIHGVQTVTR